MYATIGCLTFERQPSAFCMQAPPREANSPDFRASAITLAIHPRQPQTLVWPSHLCWLCWYWSAGGLMSVRFCENLNKHWVVVRVLLEDMCALLWVTRIFSQGIFAVTIPVPPFFVFVLNCKHGWMKGLMLPTAHIDRLLILFTKNKTKHKTIQNWFVCCTHTAGD